MKIQEINNIVVNEVEVVNPEMPTFILEEKIVSSKKSLFQKLKSWVQWAAKELPKASSYAIHH